MPVTDEARNHLFNTLREALGADDAATMMELLPPVGWSDVARQHDLLLLRQELEVFGANLRAEWRRDLLGAVFALLTANIALATAVFAAAKLS